MVGDAMISFSLIVNHAPWVPERVEALDAMLAALLPNFDVPFMLNSTDYRGTDWQASKVKWATDQWLWSASQRTTHHVFMTDDLNIAPSFWPILSAMVEGSGAKAIGLLSNHPRGHRLFLDGEHAYRCNSWIVGPAYALEHETLLGFLRWYGSLPDGPHTVPGTKAWANDDSSINEWITHHSGGLTSWHPLPTIIEHRKDLASTVGHGDEFSYERLSWRMCPESLDEMRRPEFWASEVQLLQVGGA